MERTLGRYLWMLQLAAIAGCALLLGDAVARLVDARLTLPPMRPPRRAAAHPVHRTSVDRDLFCSSCSMAAVAAPPRPSELHLGLVATLCPLGGGCTLALVRNFDDRSLRLYAVDDRLRDATVTEIRPTHVALLRDGQSESLDLLAAARPSPPSRRSSRCDPRRPWTRPGTSGRSVPTPTRCRGRPSIACSA